MKSFLFILLFSGLGIIVSGQSENQPPLYNLGFEEFLPNTEILKDWKLKDGKSIPGESFSLDNEIKHSGKQSLLIDRTAGVLNNYNQQFNIKIDVNCNVRVISGSFWIKTEELTDPVCIWLYMEDADGQKVKEFLFPVVNIYSPGLDTLSANAEWKQFFLNSCYIPDDAHNAFFGFSFTGNGKVWIDDIELFLDYKTVQNFKKQPRFHYKAFKDTKEFREGSGIEIDKVTPLQIESLSLLCKIWGLLKYYHPSVASGNYNWDFELFRILPDYLKLKNKDSINDFLVNWINKLGDVPLCYDCLNPICKAFKNSPDSILIRNKECTDESLNFKTWLPDLDWINDKRSVNDTLSQLLNYIKINRFQGKHFYVSLGNHISVPYFLNENWYDQFSFPDTGYRLLCLFRYWNIVQYWFPNKHLMDEDWKVVLNQFIPKMVEVKDDIGYILATEQLIGKIQDSHALIMQSNYNLLNRYRGIYYPPVSFRFVNNEPVVLRIINDSLAKTSNLLRGDIIKRIDGKKTKEIIAENLPNLPGSNYTTQLRDLAERLLRNNNKHSELTIERNGKLLNVKLQRFRPDKWSEILPFNYQCSHILDSSFFFIKPGIGYISINAIKSNQVDDVFSQLKNSKGLIIDCRIYPGENPVRKICDYLYPDEKIFILFRFGNEYYPGLFANYSSSINPITAGKKNENYYKGQVVILCDEYTQSQSEWTIMMLRQAPGSLVIGSTTAGADGGMTMFYLPGRIFTGFSGISPLNPDESETQRIGIIPDIEVKRTVTGIRDGVDEYLEKAVEIINAK